MNIRILVRKILGRKGTFALRNILSSISINLKLVEPAHKINKDQGITAMICTYNEPDWIEPSLLSIKDLVDEYIIVDSSTDKTPNIIEKIKNQYGLNIKIYRIPPGDLVAARNLVLKKARYKWILHWDADFIAKPELIPTIKELISNLDSKYYYLIYWPHIQLCGDLHHVCRQVFHIEHWLFTWSPKLFYTWLDRYDSLIAPIYMYKTVFINKPLSLHLRGVRNPKRIAFKSLWWRFRKEFNELAKQGINLEEYAKKKALEIYGTDDLEEVGKKIISDYVKKLPIYDKDIYGDYPPILKKYVKKIGLSI